MTDKDISNLDEETQIYIRGLREEAKNNRIKASNFEAAKATADETAAKLQADLDAAKGVQNEFNTLRDEHGLTLAENAKTQLELAKVKAALDAGLPHTFADRLHGADEAAIKADALKFKESLGQNAPRVSFDVTKGSPVGPETGPLFPSIVQHLAQIQGE